MLLLQDIHVVQTFATNISHQSLHVRMLLWGVGGNDDLCDLHVPDALPHVRAIDLVAVAQPIAWCVVPLEGVNHLLSCPRCRGMLGHMNVHHSSAVVGQDEPHNQELVRQRGAREAIEGDQVLPMVLEAALPWVLLQKLGVDTFAETCVSIFQRVTIVKHRTFRFLLTLRRSTHSWA
jgi:hypothetical protein